MQNEPGRIKKKKGIMRSAIFVIIAVSSLVWSLGTIASAHAQGQSADAELQKLQGTWALIAGEMDGKKVADADLKKSRLTFDGKKIEVITPHQSKDMIVASVTKLDPTKNPKEIQWLRTTGPNTGKTLTAIYEFEGPDRYKMCFDPAGLTVPKKFATQAGSGLILHTWKRLKQ